MALAIPYTAVLTQGIYSSLVTGISTMTFGIFSTVKSIYKHENPDITNHLRKLDIEYQLRLISSILNKHSESSVMNIKEHIDNKSVIFTTLKEKRKTNDPIEVNLSYLSKIIDEIHRDLIQLDKKVSYHNSKYFCGWRTLNVSNILSNLDTNSAILKNRFDDFVKLCTIYKS